MEIKLNKLANNFDIRLLKGTKTSIDSSLENKRIAYCFELPFGIISISSYVNTETMNIISSDLKMNTVLANNPNNLFYSCLNT